ncbi:MAG: OmpA family protein [Epsilonproteobacteria bacterium]|nr:OmpA family protein [Campylobacterota bacterium]
MKKRILTPLIASSVAVFMLSGCVPNQGATPSSGNSGQMSNTQTGAIVGGLLGAVIGGTTSNKKGKRVAIGGALGAAVGAAVGYSMDQQAKEVAQAMNTNVDNNPNAEQDANRDLIVSNTDNFVKIMFRDPMMFVTNSSVPTPSAQAEIRQMIPVLQNPQYANTIIQTVGHTDSRGSYQYNMQLSNARASSVGNTLHQGNLLNQIFSKGCSFSKPVAPNTSERNMALNRRVEIYLYPNQNAVVDPCVK